MYCTKFHSDEINEMVLLGRRDKKFTGQVKWSILVKRAISIYARCWGMESLNTFFEKFNGVQAGQAGPPITGSSFNCDKASKP
jgi:hypothetical protein